jgi:anti-anti-sigma factor
VIGTLINNRTNEEYAVEGSPTPVGRHEANRIRLKGFAVSRFHAEIGELEPGKPYIEDMGSTYGTYVNGRKVDGRVSLHDGDEVRLAVSGGFPDGEYSFTFRATEQKLTAAPSSRAKDPTRHSIREGQFEVSEREEAYVIRLDGVFRRHECDAFSGEIQNLMREKPKHVVLEMSRVEYMNSYGLGILVRLSQDLGAESRKIALASAQGLVLKLFQTVGIDQRLPCYPTEQDALSALTSAARS